MGDEGGGQGTLTTAQITVFNQSYRVRSADGGGRAERVARLVDARMRETASHVTTHDVAKIAVLTALQLADELITLKELEKREHDVTTAEEGAGENAPTVSGEESPAARRGTWFDSIFDAEPAAPPDARGGRMGSGLSERLRTARQNETDTDVTNDGQGFGND